MKLKLLALSAFLIFISSVIVLLYGTIPFIFSLSVHRFLHILGAILFLGNILIGAMWMILTDIAKSAKIFRFSISSINTADIIFTAPGAFLLLFNGAALANNWSSLWNVLWLKFSIIIFIAIGLLWICLLVPMQIYFETESKKENFEEIYQSTQFKRHLIKYFVTGSITGLGALTILFFMIIKPN